MNKYKKLIGNSLVFAVGNFGSKVINLVMVPLYTFVLSPQQYGTIDLITTTISLLVPILSLSIGEAVIRFVMVNSKNKLSQKYVLSNALGLNFISQVLFLLLIFPIMRYFHVFGGQLNLFTFLLFLQQVQITLAQFTRGMGHVKAFALNGIFMTLITATMNIVLLVKFDMALNGYLLSLILANLTSCIYLFYVVNGKAFLNFKYMNFQLFKDMISYSAPLIPNMIMWWVISGSTRYFILYFLGATVNGLFAVANKIPAILSMFTTIFQQAWQLSAFEEYNSEDNKKFFSNVFTAYSQFLFIGCSILLLFIKFIIPHIINMAYFDSWKIIPFLLIAVVYQSFSSFIGTNYTASMKTKGVLLSSIFGGIVSLICNFIFIPLLGITGTGIGTFFSFFVMFIYRYIDSKKYFSFQIEIKKFLINNLILFIQIILLFFIQNDLVLFVCELLLFCSILYFNRKIFSLFFSKFKKKTL